MAVRVTNFSTIGGTPAVTSFVDTFIRNDTAQGLGAQYLGIPRSSLQSAAAMPSFRILTNQLVYGLVGAAGGSQVPGVMYVPVSLINPAVYGLAQFAELTWQSHGGADTDVGPGVMFTGDTASLNQNGYMIEVEAPNLVLARVNTSLTSLASVAYAPAAGDVWRLEVRPTAAANALTVKINGATVMTFSDNNAARPIATGYPIIWGWACVAGASDTFSRFAAGIL